MIVSKRVGERTWVKCVAESERGRSLRALDLGLRASIAVETIQYTTKMNSDMVKPRKRPQDKDRPWWSMATVLTRSVVELLQDILIEVMVEDEESNGGHGWRGGD